MATRKPPKFYQFAVYGRNGFPMDALRLVQGWPSDFLSSNEIIESYKGNKHGGNIPFMVNVTSRLDPESIKWSDYKWAVAAPSEIDAHRLLRRV